MSTRHRHLLATLVAVLVVTLTALYWLSNGQRYVSGNHGDQPRPPLTKTSLNTNRNPSLPTLINSTSAAAVTSIATAIHPPSETINMTSAFAKKTLVLSVRYPGQQGSGALCLSTLQCFLSSFYKHFYLLEPYVHNSHLTHKKSSLNFSSLFNFEIFNSESKKVGYPQMVSQEYFQEEETKSQLHHRYIIYVHIKIHHEDSVQRVVWSANQSSPNEVHCFDLEGKEDYAKIAETYRRALHIAKSQIGSIISRRCLVRLIELQTTTAGGNIMPKRTVSSLFDFIVDQWDPEGVLLIFTRWPKIYIPVEDPLNGVNCLQENIKAGTIFRHQFQASESLVEDSKRYEQMFLNGKNRLAIMFRVERVVDGYLREKENRGKTIEGCFQEGLNLKAEMDKKYTEEATPLVTMDVGGKYGTDSFYNKSIENLSRKVLENLYRKNSWSMADWENSFVTATRGKTDGGYIAALQRLLASRADCMILLGGGDFQAFAVTDYLDFHKRGEKCVHLVCSISQENNEVHNTLYSGH